MKCYICPRKCGADRRKQYGFCGCNDIISIRRAAPHFWEEPCISGTNGSGTIFFEGCQLHCVFCQNYKISEIGHICNNSENDFLSLKSKIDSSSNEKEIINLFIKLKDQNVHNINLVTPDMYIPQLIPIIRKIKSEGFDLPFIMNCSGYESTEMIKSLRGIIDIYLPDFKYMSPLLSKKYSSAPDYSEIAKKAIEEMVSQQQKCIFDEKGILQKGVIVRHMLIPSNVHDSKKILNYLHQTYGEKIYISIMNQYTPVKNHKFKELNRKVYESEYEDLLCFARSIGIEKAFIQEGEAADESFIPDFSKNSII